MKKCPTSGKVEEPLLPTSPTQCRGKGSALGLGWPRTTHNATGGLAGNALILEADPYRAMVVLGTGIPSAGRGLVSRGSPGKWVRAFR